MLILHSLANVEKVLSKFFLGYQKQVVHRCIPISNCNTGNRKPIFRDIYDS